MKLLFDAMLSPRLPARLGDVFPGSRHVLEFGVEGSDTAIWLLAGREDLLVVTKDNDFNWRAELLGPPPKVVRVRLGNCRSRLVESLLRMSLIEIESFVADPAAALLVRPLLPPA